MNFAITGAAGYIAPRHLQAIKEAGHQLTAALDPHDAVGILDRYFEDVAFFTEFERFDRHIERLRHDPEKAVQYLSICSPNYLHDAHVRFALRIGAHAICEKPLVLNPWNCEALLEMAQEHGRKVYTVLQLREHGAVQQLRERERAAGLGSRKREIELTYVTSRGPWYLRSWKGNLERSGGLATNIGIHFFDMLLWIYGGVERLAVHLAESRRTAGYLELERARVVWYLSIAREDLPAAARAAGKTTFRAIKVDGQEVEFSGGFERLHNKVYSEILAGRGFTAEDALPSIRVAHDVRVAAAVTPGGPKHPLLAGPA
jgi:UDP-N-acetyl-2-amino-2-deoxyglucuronate dehydrogenase